MKVYEGGKNHLEIGPRKKSPHVSRQQMRGKKESVGPAAHPPVSRVRRGKEKRGPAKKTTGAKVITEVQKIVVNRETRISDRAREVQAPGQDQIGQNGKLRPPLDRKKKRQRKKGASPSSRRRHRKGRTTG